MTLGQRKGLRGIFGKFPQETLMETVAGDSQGEGVYTAAGTVAAAPQHTWFPANNLQQQTCSSAHFFPSIFFFKLLYFKLVAAGNGNTLPLGIF